MHLQNAAAANTAGSLSIVASLLSGGFVLNKEQMVFSTVPSGIGKN